MAVDVQAEAEPEANNGAMPSPFPSAGEIMVSNVHKSFGMTRALDGCTFSAHSGEIHALVGGNGSGKSTLAKVMSGVLPVDSGQVSVLGHAPSSPREARGYGIATVFQEVFVADQCSIVDNLFLGADSLWSKSLSTRAKAEAAHELMAELLGGEINVELLAGDLPLSVKQWITIGRALLSEPRVLILDESSAALDLDSTERLFDKIRVLRDQGVAVLIVTHRIAELVRISDRATVLRDGRDVGVLVGEEITERNLLGLMTGRSKPAAQTGAHVQEVLHGAPVLKTRGLKVWPDGGEIDFALHEGEILGITGLDGQGQSEFVQVLAGVMKAEQSRPTVRRRDGGFAEIAELSDATDHGVSYVSGDRKREGIFANLSIYENLLMPLYRAKSRAGRVAVVDWRALASVFAWEVERLAIKLGEATDKITSLSGGNQQKVLIGRAFALNPEVLILNDPARGVDVGAKAELYRHLTAFAARGKSVVYLSSEIEEFLGFCTRVLVFRHGSIFAQVLAEDIDPDLILEAMFGHAQQAHRHAARAEPEPGGQGQPRRVIRENLPPWLRQQGWDSR